MKRLIFALFLSAILVQVLNAQTARANRPVLIKVSKIYVGNDQVISPGMVLVKGGKIIAVGKSIEIPEGTIQINKPGWTLTPGLIDAAASGFGNSTEGISEVIPGFKVTDGLDLGSKHLRTLAKEGVTTVFITASNSSVLGCQGAIAKTGRTPRVLNDHGDPKLTISHSASSGNRGPSRFSKLSVYTRRPTSQMGIIFVARDALTKAKAYAASKKFGLKVEMDVHKEVLSAVLGGKKSLRVRAEEQYELSAALRLAEEFGFRPIFENAIEAWRVAAAMKKQSAAVVFGPVIPPVQAPVGRFGRRRPLPRMRANAAKQLVDHGVTMALTAGGHAGEQGLARQAEYAMRHGLTRLETVKAVTSQPAALLGLKNVGLIKLGYDADFVLWTGEPFAATSRPGRVFIDGVAVSGKTF